MNNRMYTMICEIDFFLEASSLSHRSLEGLCERKVVYIDHNWDKETEDIRLLTEEASDYVRQSIKSILPQLKPLDASNGEYILDVRCLDGSTYCFKYDKCVEKIFDQIDSFEDRYYEKMFGGPKCNITSRPTPYLMATAEEAAGYVHLYEVLSRCIEREEYKELIELLTPTCIISVPEIPRLKSITCKDDLKKEFSLLDDHYTFKLNKWELDTTLCGWVNKDCETGFYIIVSIKKKAEITELRESKYFYLTAEFDSEGKISAILMNDVRPASENKVRTFTLQEAYSIKRRGVDDFQSEIVNTVSIDEIRELSSVPETVPWVEKQQKGLGERGETSQDVNGAHKTDKASDFVALRCPSCGAPLTYNAEEGTYSCTYCGVSFIMKAPPKKSPNDALNMAKREYEKGRYSDARKYYALALKEDPDCWEADLGVATCDMLKSKWNNYHGDQFKSDVKRIEKQIEQLPTDEICAAKYILGRMVADVALYCNNNLEDPVNDAELRNAENSRNRMPDVRYFELDSDIKSWLVKAAELMFESEPGDDPMPQEKVDIIELLFNYVYAKDKYIIRTGYGIHPIDDDIKSTRDSYLKRLKERNPLYKFIDNVRIRY